MSKFDILKEGQIPQTEADFVVGSDIAAGKVWQIYSMSVVNTSALDLGFSVKHNGAASSDIIWNFTENTGKLPGLGGWIWQADPFPMILTEGQVLKMASDDNNKINCILSGIEVDVAATSLKLLKKGQFAATDTDIITAADVAADKEWAVRLVQIHNTDSQGQGFVFKRNGTADSDKWQPDIVISQDETLELNEQFPLIIRNGETLKGKCDAASVVNYFLYGRESANTS